MGKVPSLWGALSFRYDCGKSQPRLRPILFSTRFRSGRDATAQGIEVMVPARKYLAKCRRPFTVEKRTGHIRGFGVSTFPFYICVASGMN